MEEVKEEKFLFINAKIDSKIILNTGLMNGLANPISQYFILLR